MHEYSKKIGEHIKSCYSDFNKMNVQELEELEKWACIMKDLTEYDVNKRAIEAMDEYKEDEKLFEKMGMERMGYRGRDSRGRFVHRPGRGRSAGYTPYAHMMPPVIDSMYDEYDGMMPEDYRMGYSEGRGGRSGNYGGSGNSGNSGGQGNNSGRYGYSEGDRGGSRYGESYDDYRRARRHYSETKSLEHQKEMKEKIGEVFDDMEAITVDMVKDMSAEDKQKYKVKLQQMMQKIQ